MFSYIFQCETVEEDHMFYEMNTSISVIEQEIDFCKYGCKETSVNER